MAPSSIRILLITAKFSPEVGGVCAVAEALAASFPENIAVSAPKTEIGPHPIRDWPAFDRQFPFPVYRVEALEAELSRRLSPRLRGFLQFAWNSVWIRPKALFALWMILRRHPTDVLCINSLSCYWVLFLKRLQSNLRTVFYLHGEEVNDGPNKRKLDHLAQVGLRQGDAVVAVSSFTRDRALRCGVSPDKLFVIHNGVDLSRFSPGPRDPSIQARFHLQHKKVLLCLARLDERKGQDKLIEAMPEILIAVPDTVLLIVGGGDYESHLRHLVDTLCLAQAVLFAGVASDAERTSFYRTADVYVMPNRTTDSGDTEGFGLVFLEAGACARPVIGGLAGGVPDAILDGETGLLVDGRSSPQIANACIMLLTDEPLAATLGQNGLRHSMENTWKAQARKLLECCENLYPEEAGLITQ